MKPYRQHNGHMLPRKKRKLFVLPNPHHKRYVGAANLNRFRAMCNAQWLKSHMIFTDEDTDTFLSQVREAARHTIFRNPFKEQP